MTKKLWSQIKRISCDVCMVRNKPEIAKNVPWLKLHTHAWFDKSTFYDPGKNSKNRNGYKNNQGVYPFTDITKFIELSVEQLIVQSQDSSWAKNNNKQLQLTPSAWRHDKNIATTKLKSFVFTRLCILIGCLEQSNRVSQGITQRPWLDVWQ